MDHQALSTPNWQAISAKNVADILPTAAWVLTILNVIYAVTHHILLPPEIASILTPIDALAAALIIGVDIYCTRRQNEDPYFYAKLSPHLILFFYALLFIISSTVSLYLKQNPLDSTDYMIIAIGAGSLMLRYRYFIATIALTVCSWLWVVNSIPPKAETTHFAFAIMGSVALSFIIFIFRRKSLYAFEALRQKEMIHQKELLRSAKMVALGEMASGIAHEINNPLMIILGKASVLKKSLDLGQVDRDRAIADVEKIESMVMRVSKIIKGLNVFSRKSDMDPKQVYSLHEILEDTLGLCHQKISQSQINIQVELDQNYKIYCRPPQISQVLLNLISNSLDAIEKSPERWIRVTARDLGEAIEVRLIDSGNRISPEVQEKIMQPFFTTKELGRGTGLGLSISKGIVEDHGGSLYYDPSCPNTCFVMVVPKSENAIWSKSSLDFC